MKYGEIEENIAGKKYYWVNEDAIIDEAFERLDDKLKEKFEAYEKGYGTYFKDFEQWFVRYAPKTWSDVMEEMFEEKADAEEEIMLNDNEEQEAKEYEEYNRMIDREYYRDRI